MTKVGTLVTPTGRLVMSADAMHRDRAAWLNARRERDEVPGRYCIGSSEVPSILDLEGVDTPAHVYRRKVYNIETPTNEAMIFGSILEAPIAAEWARRNRVVTDEIGLLAHADKPWHQTTVDRRVRECPVYKGTDDICIAEIKNMGFSSASRWHADLPDRILAQIVHQLYVTGVHHAHYACLVGGNTLKQGIVYADREADLMAYVVSEVDRFREQYLLAGVEPAWSNEKPNKMIELDKASHPERIGELDINGVDAVHEYAAAAARESIAKKDKERAKAKLLQLADGAEVVTFAGELAYQFRPTERTNVNLDRLRERHPAAYADAEVVSKTNSHTIVISKAYKVPTREDKK